MYVMEYGAMKKKLLLPIETVWVKLEDIMLSEISQREKDKFCIVSLICGIIFWKTSQG